MADDQANRSGQFVTNLKGQVPPLTTTQFTVLDQGNASPRLIRSSVYNVPTSPDMLKQVREKGQGGPRRPGAEESVGCETCRACVGPT